jgi:predicted nuclease with TOPRIM domain
MSAPKKTLAAVVAALFPKSEQAIAETLNTEQFNAFAEDAQEVHDRLTAQQTGNEAVAADLTKAQARVSELENTIATMNQSSARLTELEASVTNLTTELQAFGETTEARTDYKAKADLALKQADNLRNAHIPPVADATTTGGDGARSWESAPWNKHLH